MDAKPIRKTFAVKVLEQRKDGGRIVINTASVDRDRDRVFPSGANIENYSLNPVVQWGHDYRSPWATIGKTIALDVTPEGIVADFELRPAANDQDPQNVVRLLWEGGWVRTASIGFIPKAGKPNDQGGTDFTEWELLEWSLVPIPSNQDALRLAVKGLDTALPKELVPMEPGGDANADPGRAWVRRLTVENDMGQQTLYAAFRKHTVDVPENATLLQFDFVLGGCESIPHPDAGKTVTFKDAVFFPPLEYVTDSFGKDAVYSRTLRDCSDEDAVKAPGSQWDVVELSEVVDALPLAKSLLGIRQPGFGIDILTRRGIENAEALALKQIKRGRVLSSKNESKIRAARDNLNEVLADVEEQPADDGEGKDVSPAAEPAVSTLDATDERDLADGLRILTDLIKENYQ